MMNTNKHTIFVTGAAGFIGLNFVNYILKHTDWNIVGIDKLTYASKLDIFNNILLNYPNRLILIKEDICNGYAINNLFKKYHPKYLVNFAAESHVDNSINNSSVFIFSNIVGTYTLLECSRKYISTLTPEENFRFHHVSTDEVYGDIPLDLDLKFTEKSNLNPSSPYSASKASADLLTKAWYRTYGLPITISNCSNNFGLYQHDEKFIPTIIRNIVNNKAIPIYGDGKNVRDWLFVDEHCSAIVKILTNGKIGETYCVGCNCELSNITIVNLIRNLIKEKYNIDSTITYITDRLGHDKKYVIDSTKLKTELNWIPAKNNQLDYLSDVVDFYFNYYKNLN